MENAESAEFNYSEEFAVNDKVKKVFDQKGYIVLRNFLDQVELNKLKSALENEKGVMSWDYRINDGEGGKTCMVLWNQPGNDITGIVARSEKVAGTMERLLGGEVYHYHTKVVKKEPFTGGAFAWHQDYGYWYKNGIMFPNMGTVWIAIDDANQENGCLKFLSGSNRMGRIDHGVAEDQLGADPERLKHAEKFCPLAHAEVKAGDAIFFHCNLLHRSDANRSPNRRWAFLIAFNRADNNPVFSHHHPQYTPLKKVPDSSIRDCDIVTDMSGKDFFDGKLDLSPN